MTITDSIEGKFKVISSDVDINEVMQYLSDNNIPTEAIIHIDITSKTAIIKIK